MKIEQVKESNGECRWCGTKREPSADPCSFIGLACKQCHAQTSSCLTVSDPDGHDIRLWHNPDNSIFIEFVAKDGKTARYNLSAEMLLKTGALQLFDKNPEGRKKP